MKREKGEINVLLILALVIALLIGIYVIFLKPFAAGLAESDKGMGSFAETRMGNVVRGVNGVLRTSGLSDKEKKDLGLEFATYQVTDFKAGSGEKVVGYYLETNEVIYPTLEGRCVRVIGSIKDGWGNVEKDLVLVDKNTYQRSALVPTEVKTLKFSSCSPYVDKSTSGSGKISLQGIIHRFARTAPDINYDYELTLSVPFVDKETSSGSSENTNFLVIVPANNSIWEKVEKNIGREVTIEGAMAWGYSESRYFRLSSIK